MSTFDDEPFEQPTPPPTPRAVDPRDPREYRAAQAAVAACAPHEFHETRADSLRNWWNALAPEDQRDMAELFENSPEGASTIPVCEYAKKQGKVPLVLITWAKARAKAATA